MNLINNIILYGLKTATASPYTFFCNINRTLSSSLFVNRIVNTAITYFSGQPQQRAANALSEVFQPIQNPILNRDSTVLPLDLPKELQKYITEFITRRDLIMFLSTTTTFRELLNYPNRLRIVLFTLNLADPRSKKFEFIRQSNFPIKIQLSNEHYIIPQFVFDFFNNKNNYPILKRFEICNCEINPKGFVGWKESANLYELLASKDNELACLKSITINASVLDSRLKISELSNLVSFSITTFGGPTFNSNWIEFDNLPKLQTISFQKNKSSIRMNILQCPSLTSISLGNIDSVRNMTLYFDRSYCSSGINFMKYPNLRTISHEKLSDNVSEETKKVAQKIHALQITLDLRNKTQDAALLL